MTARGARLRPAGPSRRARARAGEHACRLRDRACDRRDHARTRPRDDQGRRAGRQPRPHVSIPDITRGPDGKFLERARARRSARSPSPSAALRRRPAQARHRPMRRAFPSSSGADGARIPALTELFDLVQALGADHVRFNIETKITPTSGAETPDPETLRGGRRQGGARGRPDVARERAVVRLAHACGDEAHRAGDRARLPHRRSAERRQYPARQAGPSPWTAGLDIDDFGGSVPRLVAAAGCAVWSPSSATPRPRGGGEAKALGLKVIPWTVNERADMERLIALGVDGIITDYPDRLRAVHGRAHRCRCRRRSTSRAD